MTARRPDDPRFGRRAFLRGAAGTLLALPALESLAPAPARADEPGQGGEPPRLILLFVPNGKHMPDWTPAQEGPGFELPWLLEPLAAYRDDLLLLSGLALDGARSHGDGPGDHARAAGAFLTGAHPFKTGGSGIRNGVSVDQVAARQLGARTRFPSLELGCEPSKQGGSCDSGYSCAYSSNIAWRSPTAPVAKEINPRRVFERLFVDGEARLTPEERARRRRGRLRVLDHVLEDSRRLRGQLGAEDRSKLDEYLESVRELERRLNRAADDGEPEVGIDPPAGVPADHGEHIRLLHDLSVLAFRNDLTRVVTFMVGNAGSNRTYPELGIHEGHHRLSHHGNEADKIEKIRAINRWHVEQLAHLLGRLREAPAGEGTLLDRTLVVYGSAIADGNRHAHHDLPILLAGGRGLGLTPGRHLRFPRDTPLCNLYLSLLQRVGVRQQAFGDSTGPLHGLG